MKKICIVLALVCALIVGFIVGQYDVIKNIKILDKGHIELKGEVYTYE